MWTRDIAYESGKPKSWWVSNNRTASIHVKNKPTSQSCVSTSLTHGTTNDDWGSKFSTWISVVDMQFLGFARGLAACMQFYQNLNVYKLCYTSFVHQTLTSIHCYCKKHTCSLDTSLSKIISRVLSFGNSIAQAATLPQRANVRTRIWPLIMFCIMHGNLSFKMSSRWGSQHLPWSK